MRLYGLFEVGVQPVLPILFGTVLATRLLLYPVGSKQVLILLLFRVVYLWKVPLVGIGSRNTEVKEAFFGWLGNPVHAIIDFDLRIILTCFVVDTEANSLKLVCIVVLVIAALVIGSVFWQILFDKLRFKKLVYLLL